ncbi:MAG: hypothetical protein PVSMB4_17350 [Ktedonobacterales bacterium]
MLAATVGTLAGTVAKSHREVAALTGPLRHALLGAIAMRLGPLLVAALLFTCGVLCALGLLLGAVTLARWRPALRWPWHVVRGLLHRRGVPALVNQGPRTLLAAQAAETALAPLPPAQPVAYPASEPGWQPLAQEITGVGRVEWDPGTLRAFAGQPEVLHRLAFCRWRYQQGQLSEFERGRAGA